MDDQEKIVNENELRADVKDIEKSTRNVYGTLGKIITIFCTISAIYHLVYAYTPLVPTIWHRSIHLSAGLFLTFLLYPRTKKVKGKVEILDYVLAFISLSFTIYLIVDYEGVITRSGIPNMYDTIFGTIIIILVLEGTRRVMGWPLVIVGLVALAYAFLGPYMPGMLLHRGYGIKRIAEEMFLTTNGIFGTPLYVSSTFVIIFMLFGAFLNQTGGAKFFIDLAFGLTGKSRGGPAKAAVLSSGLLGMISGSSYANVVGTGQFTIPLMKSVGYEPEFAGGVEAASSTGGQIMPPIMGAAAFIMAEFLGVPYMQIVVNATLPAVLYFTAIFIMVDLKAARLGLLGLPAEKLPKISKVLRDEGHLLIPLFAIIIFLFVGYSAIKASLYAVITIVLVSYLKPKTRLNLKGFVAAFEEGMKSALSVIAACGVTGLIIGIVTLTGLGLKLANIITTLSGGLLLPTLLLTMIASIIMGMGMPTTALYVILAAMVAPAIVDLGVNPIAAHLFIFYFGVFAAVTPPVALTSYLAASLAKGDPAWTAVEGFKLSLAAFIVPFVFVYSPSMLLIDTNFIEVVRICITSIAGIIALGAFCQGYLIKPMGIIKRLILLVAALTLIDPAPLTDLIGCVIFGSMYAYEYFQNKKQVAS